MLRLYVCQLDSCARYGEGGYTLVISERNGPTLKSSGKTTSQL